jgi:hypothetical protein
MIIAILTHFEVINDTLTYTQEEVASGLSNFLVCLEMFVAAVAHHKYYGFQVRPRWSRARMHTRACTICTCSHTCTHARASLRAHFLCTTHTHAYSFFPASRALSFPRAARKRVCPVSIALPY